MGASVDLKGMPLADRLFHQLVLGAGGCWLWKGANGGKLRGNSGYGIIDVEGKSVSSHRAAWLVFFGAIPDGLCVLHSCDNRRCCHPLHLYLGDKKQNRKDFMERHPRAKTLVARAHKQALKALKSWWASMNVKERAAFVARRAKRQAGKRKARNASHRL